MEATAGRTLFFLQEAFAIVAHVNELPGTLGVEPTECRGNIRPISYK